MPTKRSSSPSDNDYDRTKKQRMMLCHTWQSGNFTLVSSDDVTFRFDTHYLQSASVFFRDMLAVATGPQTVTLTDPETETAAVVNAFLTLITTNRADNNVITTELSHTANLVRFLLKYDCAPALNVLGLHLHRVVHEQGRENGIQWFLIGALMDDVDLCIAAIDECSYVGRGSSSGPQRYVHHSFNPLIMSHEVASQIPFTYFWALVRTWNETKGKHRYFAADFEDFLLGP